MLTAKYVNLRKNLQMNDINMLIAMRQLLLYTMIAVSIISVPMLIVGVLFSVLQAATQINEMTITFIPKLIVMFTLLLMFGPWMMNKLILYTYYMMNNLPKYLS